MKRLVTRVAVLALVIFFIATSLAFATTYSFTGVFTNQPHFGITPFSGVLDTEADTLMVDYQLLGVPYEWAAPVTITDQVINGVDKLVAKDAHVSLVLINAMDGFYAGDYLYMANAPFSLSGPLSSLESPSNVPLPPSAWLLGSGLLAMIVLRRPKYNFGLIRSR